MGTKKFITCDGNQAAAHVAYILSHLHPPCQNILMNGLPGD